METDRYWLSFSLDGEAQGICVVQATSKIDALKKAKELDIIPKHDDIEMFMLVEDQDLVTENVLLTPEELYDIGYKATQSEAYSSLTIDDILKLASDE